LISREDNTSALLCVLRGDRYGLVGEGKRNRRGRRGTQIHEAQLLSYLRLSGKKPGLLLNLNVLHMRDGIRRMVNGL